MNYPNSDAPNGEQINYWQKRVPVISTCHITKEDGEYLMQSHAGCWTCGHPREPLVLDSILAGGDSEDICGHLLLTNIDRPGEMPAGMSTGMGSLLLSFHRKGYPWIILDRDGDVLSDMPTFDW